MKTKLHIIRTLSAALSAAIAAIVLLPSLGLAQDYPSKPIRLIVPFNTGGSNDRLARAFAPHLSEVLNTPVVVENKPGAGTLLGHTYFLQQPADGYALLVTAPHPYMSNNILTQNAPFTLDDLAWINLPWEDTSLIVTAKDKPFDSLGDLIQEIRNSPGEVSIGVVANSSDHINAVIMLDAVGIDPNTVKWVTYAGGGPLRTAIAGGHVDAGATTADGTLSVFELVRPLVIFGDERIEPWNAPPISEALQEQDAQPRDYLAGSIRGIGAHASVQQNHPERWKTILDAVQTISSDPEIQKEFSEKGMQLQWPGHERSESLIRKNYGILESSADLMAK